MKLNSDTRTQTCFLLVYVRFYFYFCLHFRSAWWTVWWPRWTLSWWSRERQWHGRWGTGVAPPTLFWTRSQRSGETDEEIEGYHVDFLFLLSLFCLFLYLFRLFLFCMRVRLCVCLHISLSISVSLSLSPILCCLFLCLSSLSPFLIVCLCVSLSQFLIHCIPEKKYSRGPMLKWPSASQFPLHFQKVSERKFFL